MIPPEAFQERLREIDPNLFVRWENHVQNEEGEVSVVPFQSPAFSKPVEELPTDGRWSIYHKDAHGKPYWVLDACGEGGTFHPLDQRVLRHIRRCDGTHGAWEGLDESAESAAALKQKEARESHPEVDEMANDALEQTFREGTGLSQHALGAVESPAVARSGYYVQDKRRFAEYAEA